MPMPSICSEQPSPNMPLPTASASSSSHGSHNLGSSTCAVANAPGSVSAPAGNDSGVANATESLARLKVALEKPGNDPKGADAGGGTPTTACVAETQVNSAVGQLTESSSKQGMNNSGKLDFSNASLEELFTLILKTDIAQATLDEFATKFCDANFSIPGDFFDSSDPYYTEKSLCREGVLLCDCDYDELYHDSLAECIARRDEINSAIKLDITEFIKESRNGDTSANPNDLYRELCDTYENRLYEEGLMIMDKEARKWADDE